jgi:hypothetical protein
MKRRRKDLGFDLSDAETAIVAFVNLITAEGPAGDTARSRLYSAGLTPDFVYALRNKRQRKLGAAKLVAALVACEDLQVVVEGKAAEDAPARRWLVRAEVDRTLLPPPAGNSSGRPVQSIGSDALTGGSFSSEQNWSGAIQLSLFSRLESPESADINIQDVRFTRKEAHRADIRMDFVLRHRQAS